MSKHPNKPSDWIAELFHKAARSPEDRRIGIEVERLGMWEDFQPFLYSEKSLDGKSRPGAETLLSTLSKTNKWPLISNQWGKPLGLTSPWGKVTLEPGSQVELSADPCANVCEVVRGVDAFESKVKEVTLPWGLHWIGLGLNPIHKLEELELIPSPRYAIMTDYFQKTGKFGTTMMRRTTSVQLNLDYSSESEAIEMLRTALLASPMSYALFGNSPFLEGKETGFVSFRSEVWRQTDPFRTGLIPEAFDRTFSFKTYADFLWKRPLMFAQDSKGAYVPALGKSLEEIADGKLPGVMIDENNQWNAARELFTEARIKTGYIEVRNIDGLMPEMRNAAAAFWVGLLYGEEARKLTLELFGKIPFETIEKLWIESTRSGLGAKVDSIDLKKLTQVVLGAVSNSLKNRGFGEEVFLTPLFENLDKNTNPGQDLLHRFHSDWNRDIRKVVLATRM